MSDNTNEDPYKYARKSKVARFVSRGFGVCCEICGTKLAVDILENIAPEPPNMTTKIMYGLGGYCLGHVAGKVVQTDVENMFMSTSEFILRVKNGDLLGTQKSQSEKQN